MSAPVGVLARIEAAWGKESPEYSAVAELIEQRDTLLNALKRALPHVEHAYHTHEDLDGSFWIDVVGCRNALARVQGVKS